MRHIMCLAIAFAALGWLAVAPARAVLVNHWPMEEGSGATAADVVGGNNLTLTNIAWSASVAPPFDGSTQSLSYNGTTSNATATGYTGITGGAARTISAWINTSIAGDAIASWGTNMSGQKWVMRVNDTVGNGTIGGLRVEVNGGFRVGLTDLSDGAWHHVVAALPADGTTNISEIRFYVDGKPEPISSEMAVGVNTVASVDVRIGNDPYSAGRNFDGLIDDVRIYNHTFGSADARALFNGDATPQAVLSYIATTESSPNDGVWNEINQTHNPGLFDISIAGKQLRAFEGGGPLKQGYYFNGTGPANWGANTQDGNFTGNPTDESATWEMWVKPSDLTGQEVLFEFGGATIGSSLTLNGNQLQFIAKDNAASGAVTTVLSSVDAAFHVVAVIDLDADLVSLYLNGELVGTNAFTGQDWAGSDPIGFGGKGAAVGGDTGSLGSLATYGNFTGDIGLIRFYNEPLSAAQIQQLYLDNKAIPEPTTLAAVGLAGLGLLSRRRRKA